MKNQSFISEIEIENEIQNESQLNEEVKVNETNLLNSILDNIGFTKYHLISFLLTGLILISNGIQIVMQAYLLSAINLTTPLSEYDLAYINSIENTGNAFSYLFLIILTKYISYKKITYFFIIIISISTIISIYFIDFTVACVLRMIIGFSAGIIDLSSYILLFEIVSTKTRGFISSIVLIFYPVGLLIGAFFGYFLVDERKDYIENYRNIVYFSLFFIFFIVFLVFFVQESPRSLFLKDEIEKGGRILLKLNEIDRKGRSCSDGFPRTSNVLHVEEGCCDKGKDYHINHEKNTIDNNIKTLKRLKTQIKDKETSSISSNPTENPSISKLKSIFSSDLLLYTIILWILIIISSFIYNGTAFILPTNAPNFKKKDLKDYILAVGIEIPSTIVASFMIESRFFGRLSSLRLSLLGTFISCIVMLFFKNDIIFAVFIKFFISITLTSILIYSSEIYNTNLRAFSLSLLSFLKRISIIVSPLFVSFLHVNLHFSYDIIFLVFSLFVLSGFGLSFLLVVETKDRPLDISINVKKDGRKVLFSGKNVEKLKKLKNLKGIYCGK